MVAGLVAAAAPGLAGVPANAFRTPLEVLPEWYLFPAFNLLRVLPSKSAGAGAALALLAALASAPLAGAVLLAPSSSPLRRPASAGTVLSAAAAGLGLSLGALVPTASAPPFA